MLALIGEPAHARSAVVENCSARSTIVPTIAARHYDSSRVLLGEESSSLLAKFQPLDKCREEIFMLAHVYWKFHLGLQIRVVTPLPERLIDWLHLAHLAKENNLPLQLPLVFLEILFVFGVNPNRLPALRPVGRRRPRQGLRDEHRSVRRGHANPCIQLPPSYAELAPVFQVRIRATHRGQLIACPLVRLLQIRRPGQPRPDAIHQPRRIFHDVRVFQPFLADTQVSVEIDVLDRRLRHLV